jgi:hypothetical protein
MSLGESGFSITDAAENVATFGLVRPCPHRIGHNRMAMGPIWNPWPS